MDLDIKNTNQDMQTFRHKKGCTKHKGEYQLHPHDAYTLGYWCITLIAAGKI